MFRFKHFAFAAAGFAAFGLTAGASAADVTFAKDIMPIMQKNCQECHRPGQNAPMTFMSYEEVRPWAKAIRKAVTERAMPPWQADPSIGTWKNDKRLSEKDMATFTAWIDAGAPMGNAADLPAPIKWAEGWSIGEPDMVFTMAREEVLPPQLEDEYRYVMIPTNLKEPRWLKAAEAKAGNVEVVHHIITFVSTPEMLSKGIGKGKGEARGAEGGDPGAGVLNSFLGGYAPGYGAFIMDKGEAMYLPANAILVLQMHYHKTPGTEARDRSSIAVKFADYAVEKQKNLGEVGDDSFVIPPGAGNHVVEATRLVREDITMQEIMPHMHLRGKEMKLWAEFPDGRKQDLLFVPKYDFNWQFFYKFDEPVKMPKGTKLFARAIFDNSTNNPNNPDPTKEVRWGLPTTAEMMFGFYLYTKDGEKLDARDPGNAPIPGGAGAAGGK